MKTVFVLLYILSNFIFPIFLDECCNRRLQKKITGFQQVAGHLHYRVVEGEIFMMPCNTSNPDVKNVWSKTEDGTEGTRAPSFDCGRDFIAEVKHSGKYRSSNGMSILSLQVVERISLGCFRLNETVVRLNAFAGGIISCPGLSCSNNKEVIWYQKNIIMSEQNRRFCEREGTLQLCPVFEIDTGVFFCDKKITEQGVTWTYRRAVNVTVIPSLDISPPPMIDHPPANMTEKVEIGQPHTLRCEVSFYFEIEPSAKVQWFMNYRGSMKNMTQLHMEKPQWKKENFEWSTVTQKAVINEVTLQHLNHTYTCIASNKAGKTIVTIMLRRKTPVKWPSLVGYPIATLLVVAGLGIVVHAKWMELQLIYRSHFQRRKHDGENKEYDVFLSLVWSSPSAQVQGNSTLSTRSEPLLGEAHISKKGKSNTTQTALEVLLPQVLEDQWGCRLCLLERDVLPGGAYTNDVVLRINRSQMLICVLSADYLTNSNAVFVLESGVQAVLQKSLKLLLVWTNGASASLVESDPPLPKVVRRALRVLPSLDWSSDKSSTANSHFWSSLRRTIPDHRGRLV